MYAGVVARFGKRCSRSHGFYAACLALHADASPS